MLLEVYYPLAAWGGGGGTHSLRLYMHFISLNVNPDVNAKCEQTIKLNLTSLYSGQPRVSKMGQRKKKRLSTCNERVMRSPI